MTHGLTIFLLSGVLCHPGVPSARMAAVRSSIHNHCVHFNIFLVDRNGIGIDSLPVEIRFTLRISDDSSLFLLHSHI